MHAILHLTGYLSDSNISVFSNSSIKKKLKLVKLRKHGQLKRPVICKELNPSKAK